MLCMLLRKLEHMVAHWPSRKNILLGTFLFLSAICFLQILVESFIFHLKEIRFSMQHNILQEKAWLKAGFNRSDRCEIPDHNPFDPSVILRIEKFTLKCVKKHYLTFVDEEGFIHLNQTQLKVLGLSSDDVNCTFKSIDSVDGNMVKGGSVNRSPRVIGEEPMKIDAEFVCVYCSLDLKIIYENCHFYVPPPSKNLKYKNKKVQEQERANILLLGIDSVSRLSFIRNLPKSYDFITNHLQSVIMKGFNKVGLNTFPNLIPFLSGYRVYRRDDDPTQAFCNAEHDCAGFFDHRPIVWNNFSDAGYVTMFSDEWIKLSLFYHLAKGFKHNPTDYYSIPLIQGLEQIGVDSNDLCYGNTPTFDVLLDYTKHFVKTMKDTVYFAFTFITRISHDNDFTIQALDDNLQKFLETLYINGDFNNTILVLFGDHGRRFGYVRQTFLGAVEENMPFMSIHLPKRLREQKPHLQSALEVNSGRLLSWFDMHEMLMDLAMDNLGEESRVARWGPLFGTSPFRVIPENRTCHEAGIPPEYCVCMSSLDLDVTEHFVQEAADFLVDHLNKKLRHVPDNACAQLTLRNIHKAQLKANPQHRKISHIGQIVHLTVTITTVPGFAIFEAMVELRADTDKWKVLGDVSRLNKHSHQSHCVALYHDIRVQPYCFCVNDTSTVKGP